MKNERVVYAVFAFWGAIMVSGIASHVLAS